MSQATQNTTLSRSTRLLCYLGPPSAVLVTTYVSPKTGLFSPLAFIPTGIYYRKWSEWNQADPARRGELEGMIWTQLLTGTAGVLAVSLVQAAGGYALSTALFGNLASSNYFLKEAMRSTLDGLTADDLAGRAALASTWQNWAFNIVFMYGAAALSEETLKYLSTVYARLRNNIKPKAEKRNRSYLDYAIAGALGFAVMENIGFIYSACTKPSVTWPRILLNVGERVILGTAGHFLTALLTALRATRRDFYGDKMSWWSVIGPSVLLHGTGNVGALAFSALEGNVGWIHPIDPWITTAMLATATGLNTLAAWLVRREWQGLKELDQKQR